MDLRTRRSCVPLGLDAVAPTKQRLCPFRKATDSPPFVRGFVFCECLRRHNTLPLFIKSGPCSSQFCAYLSYRPFFAFGRSSAGDPAQSVKAEGARFAVEGGRRASSDRSASQKGWALTWAISVMDFGSWPRNAHLSQPCVLETVKAGSESPFNICAGTGASTTRLGRGCGAKTTSFECEFQTERKKAPFMP